MDNHDDAHSNRSYVLGGKIMLSAIVVLFFVVLLIVLLHLYARWYILRSRRRIRHRRRNRRTNLVFLVDPVVSSTRGLDASVLKTLPVFRYSPDTHPDPIECAVCLSEFEEGETARMLPKCNHSFHIDCIDMWFHSHSTCPLCRSPVEPFTEPVKPDTIEAPGPSSVSILKPEAIEVNAIASGDNGSQSLKSPMSRMLSLSRMLNRDRKPGGSSPSSPSCGGPVTEVDLEQGRGTTE